MMEYSQEEILKEVERRHWFHIIEVIDGVWTKGHYRPDSKWLFQLVDLPSRMEGMRTLDVGCSDGSHAFEMARRGAESVAIDLYSPDFQNVEFLSRVWNIPVTYKQDTIYQFQDQPFHIILASGVLYHLQYPLLGLHNLNRLCVMGGCVVIESHYSKRWGSYCRFLPGKELANDPSNWWIPTRKCLIEMVEASGFKVIKSLSQAKNRYLLKAEKVKDVHPALSATDVHTANFGHPPY